MGYYDTQQVCLNGHQITDNYRQSPEFRKDFCNICGEKTIYTCPKCNSEIRGKYNVDGVCMIGFLTIVPDYCHKCGTPYPWTEKRKIKGLGKLLESDSKDPLNSIEQICRRFHLVAKQLRSRHDGRPTLDIVDEYDVQDLLHSLKLYFDDIRPEEWTPSYAGSSSRMDFLLKKESIVIRFLHKVREVHVSHA